MTGQLGGLGSSLSGALVLVRATIAVALTAAFAFRSISDCAAGFSRTYLFFLLGHAMFTGAPTAPDHG